METKIQTIIICIVGFLGAIALIGAITLSFWRRDVPATLPYVAASVVSGLCGSLAPSAIKNLSQKFTGDSPTIDVTQTNDESAATGDKKP